MCTCLWQSPFCRVHNQARDAAGTSAWLCSGWAEAVRRDRSSQWRGGGGAAAVAALDEYLERMGVRDANIRQRLTAALPQADFDQVSATAARARPAQLVKPLQPAPDQAALVDPSLPAVVLVPDAEMSLTHILPAMQRLQHQVYLLLMPPQKHLAQLRSVDALASLWCASVRSRVPSGPVILAGVGPGGVVAHEMAVQLQCSGTEVGPTATGDAC
eukprot:GHUV01043246.1.p1 GENE.GHUV01043246.1~~GHUV01043246.1.p1  ORF type:complete len:215 (+),score=63.21 GHUV01043246.1:59-703(+)